VRSVKGRVETCFGGDFGSELGGLYDAVVVQGRGGSVVRVTAVVSRSWVTYTWAIFFFFSTRSPAHYYGLPLPFPDFRFRS